MASVCEVRHDKVVDEVMNDSIRYAASRAIDRYVALCGNPLIHDFSETFPGGSIPILAWADGWRLPRLIKIIWGEDGATWNGYEIDYEGDLVDDTPIDKQLTYWMEIPSPGEDEGETVVCREASE